MAKKPDAPNPALDLDAPNPDPVASPDGAQAAGCALVPMTAQQALDLAIALLHEAIPMLERLRRQASRPAQSAPQDLLSRIAEAFPVPPAPDPVEPEPEVLGGEPSEDQAEDQKQ